PSAREWPFGIKRDPVPVSRLLIVRTTRATREAAAIAREAAAIARQVLATSMPADPRLAIEALTDTVAWPGPSLIWARQRRDGSISLVAEPSARSRR
ncbi:MAG: hypothetical protein HY264_11585, partial [Chloroflexi bacterium]|nr:hypothetical protein [Chloroflexota bacterium]